MAIRGGARVATGCEQAAQCFDLGDSWATLGMHAAGAADSSAPERRGTELGFAVFQQHCVSCHGNKAYERAPSPTTLRSMSPERIYTALTTGIMKSVGDTLNEADRRRVAESLSGQFLGSQTSRRLGLDAEPLPRESAPAPVARQ